MIIVFSASIVQIHRADERINFTPICAWVSSKTCAEERENTWTM
ncbi:transcriptional regulator [Citrobacter werkmanii]|nr:transcriptional regulator [Citrobacter sp. CRE-46]AYL69136.1 transcriptional regulator [Citrobacter werkmanii]RNW29172.1 transcriptional regulator [Citrobacter werkmanii]RYH99750.1 transcriptional regulator [Citrobacter werkmanii]